MLADVGFTKRQLQTVILYLAFQSTNADGLLGVRLLADVGFTKRLLQAHNRVLAAAAMLARAEAPASPLQQHPLVSNRQCNCT